MIATKAQKDDLRDKFILLLRDRFGRNYRRVTRSLTSSGK